VREQSIICFANDWESDPTSKHHVMRVLSGSNRILWVNSISMRKPSLSGPDVGRMWRKIKGAIGGLKRVNNNLHHFTPIVLPIPSSRVARKINKYVLKASLKYYKAKLRMGDIQLWTFLPNVVDLIGSLGERLVIYYCVDEWSKFSFVNGRSMREMEMELLKKADLVITSSENLYEDKVRVNPNTHLVKHGVDYEHFSGALSEKVALAEDLVPMRRPIIGFFGLIHEWIDLDFIEGIARMRPEWSVVLIGKASVDLKRFRQHKNVHFLGQRPYHSLVEYCKGFDVGLVPFVLNDLTVNVNPIKLREYLAAGVPVVSTPLPEVKAYGSLITVAAKAEDAIEKIEELLKCETHERKVLRSEKVRNETWESKVGRISDLISSFREKG
jgi:glycosyltransferase involved in cell wall biosynthesis